MEQAAILKSGNVVKLTGLTNPKYTIYGFLNSFEAVIDGVTKKFKETVKEDFREEDLVGQIDRDVIGGFYEEQFFLEYLIDKNKLYELKNHKYTFKPASAKDEIIVRKLKVVAPYTDFCKIETYKWAYEPNIPIIDYGTWQITIPSEVLPNPLEGENVQLNGAAMQFYNHKIGLFVTPITDIVDKQAKAFLIAKIAIQINSILNIFNSVDIDTTTNFGSYLDNQKLEWSSLPIFISPTVEIFEDYMRNLTSFYKSFYTNQILIKKAPKAEKFYWFARCLSAEALATVPVNDKFDLLKKICADDNKLTERNNGEGLALKIIESFTFDSVSAYDRNYLLSTLMHIQSYNGTNKYTIVINDKQTLFEILYSKIDDNRLVRYSYGLLNSYDNRKIFILMLYKIWQLSKYNPKYADPSYTQSPDSFGVFPESYYMALVTDPESSIKKSKYYNDEKSPPFLHFESPENSGTTTDYALVSTEVEYSLGNIEENRINIYSEQTIITVQNGSREADNVSYSHSPTSIYGTYELYQPITIIGFKPDLDLIQNFRNPVTGQISNSIENIPVFFFYYMQDYSSLKKIDFRIMFATEIALNLIGVGALADLKYIGYISKLRSLGAAETAIGSTDAVLKWKAISGVVNAVEFSSFNALSLNNYVYHTTTNAGTKEVAEKMSSFLMWTAVTSMFIRPYTKSKVIESAFELDNTVTKFNQDGISIYRPEMTSTEILELDHALLVVKQIAGNKTLIINTTIQKLTEYGTDSENILNKYTQITDVTEQFAFTQDFGLLENATTRSLLNANYAKAIDNWRLLYSKGIITERKSINFLLNEIHVNGLIRFYEDINLRTILEPIEISKKTKFLDTFANISDPDFAKFVENPNFIKEWDIHSFTSAGNDLSLLSTEQKFKFLKIFENSTQAVVNRIKNGGLIKYFKIVDEHPLNLLYHDEFIKNVEYLESVKVANISSHNGELLAEHLKISLKKHLHSGQELITGYSGFHFDFAITEPNELVFSSSRMNANNKPIFDGPLPSVNAPIQTAIKSGTIRPGSGVQECEVYVWGYAREKVSGNWQFVVDGNGNPIKAWVPKMNNQGKTTVFIGLTKEKVLNEIAFARFNLTPLDWLRRGNDVSNEWRGFSSDNIKINMYIGTKTNIQPTSLPNPNINYGSAFPKL